MHEDINYSLCSQDWVFLKLQRGYFLTFWQNWETGYFKRKSMIYNPTIVKKDITGL